MEKENYIVPELPSPSGFGVGCGSGFGCGFFGMDIFLIRNPSTKPPRVVEKPASLKSEDKYSRPKNFASYEVTLKIKVK